MTLTCCCCGNGAWARKQWWNRDTGYGICMDCVRWLRSRHDYNAEEFLSCYGREGEHYGEKPRVET